MHTQYYKKIKTILPHLQTSAPTVKFNVLDQSYFTFKTADSVQVNDGLKNKVLKSRIWVHSLTRQHVFK